MGKGKNIAKLQDTALNMFKREIRNSEITKNEPTFFEKEVIRSREKDEKNPLPPAKPRISHYDPNNPLNGIFAKSLADQKELQEKMKAEGLIQRKSSSRSSKEEVTVHVDPNIKVISATYGAPGYMVDITTRVQLGKKITNRMAGGDPIHGVKKTCTIKVLLKDGTEKTKVFNEGQVLEF